MKKLIEIHQEYLIECDNPTCSFKILNPTGDINESIEKYLNVPCPMCKDNLLTQDDYLESLNFVRVVNWLNKWFSWVTFFIPKNAKKETVSVKHHNGIKIETKKS